jgi:hypothetical protein
MRLNLRIQMRVSLRAFHNRFVSAHMQSASLASAEEYEHAHARERIAVRV